MLFLTSEHSWQLFDLEHENEIVAISADCTRISLFLFCHFNLLPEDSSLKYTYTYKFL